jgi:Domain of unknown function DUF11
MRRLVAALCCATALGLSACGGGEGGGGTAATTPELRIGAAAGDTGRAPSGVVHTRRIEVRNVGGSSALAVVVSVSADTQALQLPLSCESAGCVQRSDGGIEIAEIAAGSSVVLLQRLRIKPGHRGAVRNDWQATVTGSSASWRQELTAYVADLAVTVGEPAGSTPARSYEVALHNHGPDEAAAVSWDLLTLPGQVWRIAGCTAGAGATCPAALGETMKLARLPAGSTVTLQVQVEEPADSRLNGIVSRADAFGDPDPNNNQAESERPAAVHLPMTDLEGRHYRLSYGVTVPLRATNADTDYRVTYAVDVTGTGFLGENGSVDPPWSRGLMNFLGPIMVLGLDIGGVRRPHMAPHKLVTQLSELEGFGFNVLGSRADASGKPLKAYIGSARFKEGVLQLCLPDTPTPFEQCPAARLSRFEAAMVGDEIELVSRDKAVRLRAARSADGPILISSSRDAMTGASEFWVGVPEASRSSFQSSTLSEATFESMSGHSTAVLASIDRDANNRPRVRTSGAGLPHTVLLRLISTGMLGICGLEAQLSASAQPGLLQGELRGDWLPGSFADGQFLKERSCFAGQIHHAQTVDFAVFLGAQGGALMGRWMFAINN